MTSAVTFEEFYQLEFERAEKWARRRWRRSDSEDVVQEAMIALWGKWGSGDIRSPHGLLYYYIKQFVYERHRIRTASNARNLRFLNKYLCLPLTLSPLSAWNLNIDARINMKKLPVEQRESLIRKIMGQSLLEESSLTGNKVSKVKDLRRLARLKMVRGMEGYTQRDGYNKRVRLVKKGKRTRVVDDITGEIAYDKQGVSLDNGGYYNIMEARGLAEEINRSLV
jgi:DNA-directed RNA polymerase specialized sigma24 family protein